MGNGWRLPNEKEKYELLRYCWSNGLLTENGVNGVRIYGRNEHSIFLPACGLGLWEGKDFPYGEDIAAYWTGVGILESDLNASSYNSSKSLWVDLNGYKEAHTMRALGMNIRPVINPVESGIYNIDNEREPYSMGYRDGYIHIIGDNTNGIVSVYDISGRLIYSDIINDAVCRLPEISHGVYIVSFCQRKKYNYKTKNFNQMNNAIKKLSTIMVAVLCLSATLLAHDSYYYYHGTRIPLVKSTNKIVSIAPKSDNVSLNSLEGFTLVNTISDMYGNVQVYELASSATIEQAIKEISSSVCIQRCYLSSNGVDLIPNGYINVKLKSKSDFSKLRAAAFSNGCEIMEQDQFMPLWYTLRIKESGGNNSVEAANSIYETGMFAYAFPSFSCNGYEFSYDDRIDEQWGLYNSKI